MWNGKKSGAGKYVYYDFIHIKKYMLVYVYVCTSTLAFIWTKLMWGLGEDKKFQGLPVRKDGNWG